MAERGICAVDGCDKTTTAIRWCNKHYQRWLRHGDPLHGRDRKTASGEALAWLKAHVNYVGDDCLIWPFARFPAGRAKIAIGGKTKYAYRVMCEWVHGEPPTPQHEAAHSCARGHEACVHPQHVRWATSKENGQDMVAHGNSTRGPRNPQAKLAEADVITIRSLAGKVTQAKIAERYGLHPMHVHAIIARKVWAWLE